MNAKRVYDLFFALLGLVCLSPVLLLIGLAVRWSDGGPILYGQERVGQFGRWFRIWKFRTMVPNAERMGPGVTRDGDPRITKMGRFLRKTKLDELPQLWNVLRGEMSLVGPRPEVPKYVAQYTAEQREVLQLKPGLTDLATLEFLDEEGLLRAAPDVEQFYLQYCVPRKIELNLQYARRANLRADTWIILQTLVPWSRHRARDPGA